MLAGQFILQIDWPRAHADQEAVIGDALLRDDAARVSSISAQACREHLATKDRQIDVAALARNASDAVIQHYYGVTTEGANREDITNWLTVLASAILLLPPEGSPERAKADHSADALFAHMRAALVTARQSELSDERDDVLSRLLAHRRDNNTRVWLSEDWIARTTCGLAVFGLATVARTAVDAVDELLSRGEATLSSASEAAANADKNPEILLGYIYEALRFRPMLPVLFRYCPRATVIGEATGKPRIVPRGAAVVTPPLAAMHDSTPFPDPSRFDATRPTKKSLIFGTGLHQCTGRKIAERMLVEIVGALLREPDLRREKGRSGRVSYDGAAAHRLILLRRG
ncbi:MAG: cytochrome P450, partial [Arenibacterium sp.]